VVTEKSLYGHKRAFKAKKAVWTLKRAYTATEKSLNGHWKRAIMAN